MKRRGKSQHTCNAAGAHRPGQRPLHNSLDAGEGGPSKKPAQGRGLESDVDVRVVSEDKTHQVCSLTNATCSRAALHIAMRVPRAQLLDFIPSSQDGAQEERIGSRQALKH